MRFLKTLWYFRRAPLSFALEVARVERYCLTHGWSEDEVNEYIATTYIGG